jgi:hypothetical protein
MSDFAMPQALSLEDSRRASLPAVRREVVHNTTTQNEYGPGELCYIPIETGAAGAFMDVSTTRLEATVVVRNRNYYADFIDLPRCGWNALIQEFGIELNGALHELNRHYAECIELDMIKRGENKYPYEVCRSNTWRAANGSAGKMHINFIKPSMITAMGLPHNVMYAPLVAGTTTTSAPDSISQGYLLSSQRYATEKFGRSLGVAIPVGDLTTPAGMNAPIDTYSSPAVFGTMVSSSMELAESYYDDRIREQKDINIHQYGAPVRQPTDITAVRLNTVNGTDLGEATNVRSAFRLLGLPHGGNLLHTYCRNIPSSQEGASYNVNLSLAGIGYGQSVNGFTSGQWPAKQPCDLEKLKKELDSSLRFVSGDAIHNYYANCKNIPIGVPINLSGDDSGSTKIWGANADGTYVKTLPVMNNPGQNYQETEFHISLKVYSSLIGVLAKKWFPELVVPQGRMRIRLRFQEPQILFQTSMDPCRRVPGTVRDYFPYMGVVHSADTAGAPLQIQNLRQTEPRRIASGIHPIMVTDYVPGMVYVDAIALGRFPVPQMVMKEMHKLTKAFYPNTNPAAGNLGLITVAGGGALDSNGTVIMDQYETANVQGNLLAATVGLTNALDAGQSTIIAINRLLHEIHRNQEYGYPVLPYSVFDPATGIPPGVNAPGGTVSSEVVPLVGADTHYPTIGHYQQYVWPHDYKNYLTTPHLTPGDTTAAGPLQWLGDDITGVALSAAPNTDNNLIRTNPNHDWYYKSLNWNPFCLPTPQYVPFANPQNKAPTRSITVDDYVNENVCCFGTHLEASQAQTRRSFYQLYPLQVPDQLVANLRERLTYIVKDIQLVTQQLILPRNAALSIIENALSGGITMETNAWKEIEMMLPRADSQKALINMSAAYCTDITFLFRPTETYQGDIAFGHNSFAFYNPFTSFKFLETSQTTDTNYLGGTPQFYNECVIGTRTAFDIQLQLGSELMPRTPINTINSLIKNIRWGDQVFSDADYMDLAPRLQPSYATTNGMVINTLQDGFWSCYLPISALDDQTITDNPFFVPLEMSTRRKIRGGRSKDGPLPFFKPLNGSFHLSFNLESYMGQSGRIRTGVPIVNNNMFLKFEKGHLVREYYTQLLTICNCDARVVFERGGTMQFFT